MLLYLYIYLYKCLHNPSLLHHFLSPSISTHEQFSRNTDIQGSQKEKITTRNLFLMT